MASAAPAGACPRRPSRGRGRRGPGARAEPEAEKAAEVRAFFTGKLAGVTGAGRSIDNAVERIELCAARKKVLGPQVQQALRSN